MKAAPVRGGGAHRPMGALRADSRPRRRSRHGARMRQSRRCRVCDLRPCFRAPCGFSARPGAGRCASRRRTCRASASWPRPATNNGRLAPAVAATDNALLAPEPAAGIARVKSAKSIVRCGAWLTLRHAQALPNAPDIATAKRLHDRAKAFQRPDAPSPRTYLLLRLYTKGAELRSCFGKVDRERRRAIPTRCTLYAIMSLITVPDTSVSRKSRPLYRYVSLV